MKPLEEEDQLRAEYTAEDLGKGVRGKYYADYQKSRNLVLLDPEVAKAFPDEKSVNDALKSLIRVATAAVQAAKSSES